MGSMYACAWVCVCVCRKSFTFWTAYRRTFTMYARITSHICVLGSTLRNTYTTQRTLHACVSLNIWCVYVGVCVLEWYFKLYICFIDKTLERPKRSLPSACIHSHTHIYKFAPHVLTPSTHVRSCSCSLSLSFCFLFFQFNTYVFLFTISSALIRLRFPFRLLFLFLLLVVVVVVMVFFSHRFFHFSLVCQSFSYFFLPYRAQDPLVDLFVCAYKMNIFSFTLPLPRL